MHYFHSKAHLISQLQHLSYIYFDQHTEMEAVYRGKEELKKFVVEQNREHKTDGRTNQSSVTSQEDKDKPNVLKDNAMGRLRGELTSLQDDINEFLTARLDK